VTAPKLEDFFDEDLVRALATDHPLVEFDVRR